MKNINIILPYKENYSSNNAGAVSILVSQLSRFSRFKNKIKVFGSLAIKKPITNNYIQTFVYKPFFTLVVQIIICVYLIVKLKIT